MRIGTRLKRCPLRRRRILARRSIVEGTFDLCDMEAESEEMGQGTSILDQGNPSRLALIGIEQSQMVRSTTRGEEDVFTRRIVNEKSKVLCRLGVSILK